MTHLQKNLLKVKKAAFSAIMLLACAGGTAFANDRKEFPSATAVEKVGPD